jgi:hypothetical protein
MSLAIGRFAFPPFFHVWRSVGRLSSEAERSDKFGR